MLHTVDIRSRGGFGLILILVDPSIVEEAEKLVKQISKIFFQIFRC